MMYLVICTISADVKIGSFGFNGLWVCFMWASPGRLSIHVTRLNGLVCSACCRIEHRDFGCSQVGGIGIWWYSSSLLFIMSKSKVRYLMDIECCCCMHA